MQILQGLDGLRQLPPGLVLSIGNFDGLHLGHRRILQTARAQADSSQTRLAVVTFEPHPMTVLKPEFAPPRLTPPEIKQPLIASLGADFLVVLPPVPEILDLSADRFWEILRDEIKAADLVEGSSFRFGKGAKGNMQSLRDWSAGTGVRVHVVESVEVALLDMRIAPVSSSLIRFLLDFGRVREAAICLGRAYLLAGNVVKGFGRGKGLGFATANLNLEDQLIPADGVYAGRCNVDGAVFPAAVSIGTMPTFDEKVRQIEAHLIGFNGNLYDRRIGVELLDWLREQRKYSNLDALKEQVAKDIAQTRIRVDMDAGRAITGDIGGEVTSALITGRTLRHLSLDQ